MEPSTQGNQRFISGRPYNAALTILLALAVTSDVGLAIVRHWKSYDWLGKFLGIVLLLNLVIVPLTRIIKSRKAENFNPDIMVRAAYIWLLLATILFNR